MSKQKDLLQLFLENTGKKTHVPKEEVSLQNVYGFQKSKATKYIWMPRY
jgi:hypothetical protein